MDLIDWVIANKEWVFSGVGVAITGAILTIIFKIKTSKKNNIKKVNKTTGNYSPLRVEGDYKVEVKK